MEYDLVFVYLNIWDDDLTGAEHQLDCAYIRAYLEKIGYRTFQYINHSSSSYHDYVYDLVNLNVQKNIFFINEYNYYISKIVINKIKLANPDLTIYIFGASASYVSSKLCDDLYFDVSINRHPHVALEKLCHAEKAEYPHIPNIAYRCDKSIVFTEKEEYVYSLDDLRRSAFDFYKEFYGIEIDVSLITR